MLFTLIPSTLLKIFLLYIFRNYIFLFDLAFYLCITLTIKKTVMFVFSSLQFYKMLSHPLSHLFAVKITFLLMGLRFLNSGTDFFVVPACPSVCR